MNPQTLAKLTQRAHNAKMTYQCQCKVMMLHWSQYDVILTLWACLNTLTNIKHCLPWLVQIINLFFCFCFFPQLLEFRKMKCSSVILNFVWVLLYCCNYLNGIQWSCVCLIPDGQCLDNSSILVHFIFTSTIKCCHVTEQK